MARKRNYSKSISTCQTIGAATVPNALQSPAIPLVATGCEKDGGSDVDLDSLRTDSFPAKSVEGGKFGPTGPADTIDSCERKSLEKRRWNSVNDDEREGTSHDAQEVTAGTGRWEPLFLQRATLLAFCALFFCQLIALIALFAYSSQHGGIVPVAAKWHQAWKYGPNASTSIRILSHLPLC